MKKELKFLKSNWKKLVLAIAVIALLTFFGAAILTLSSLHVDPPDKYGKVFACEQNSDCVLAFTERSNTTVCPGAPRDQHFERVNCVSLFYAEELEKKHAELVRGHCGLLQPKFLDICACKENICTKTSECNVNEDCETTFEWLNTRFEYTCIDNQCTRGRSDYTCTKYTTSPNDNCPEDCTLCCNGAPCSMPVCHSKGFCDKVQKQWDMFACNKSHVTISGELTGTKGCQGVLNGTLIPSFLNRCEELQRYTNKNVEITGYIAENNCVCAQLYGSSAGQCFQGPYMVLVESIEIIK